MKEYKIEVNGVEHTFQLSDEDAKRLGVKGVDAKGVDAKGAPAPANKSRTAKNKKA